mgnify:CR=1 FL=1
MEFYVVLRKLKDEVIEKYMTDYKIKIKFRQTIPAESIYDLYDKIPERNLHYNYYLIKKICESKYEDIKEEDITSIDSAKSHISVSTNSSK